MYVCMCVYVCVFMYVCMYVVSGIVPSVSLSTASDRWISRMSRVSAIVNAASTFLFSVEQIVTSTIKAGLHERFVHDKAQQRYVCV